MIEFDPSHCRFQPRPYQLASIKRILETPRYGLFYEMRLGKSAVVINAACALFDASELDVVVVACPAQVKGVWLDPEFGEIRKHAWVEGSAVDYCSKNERRQLTYKNRLTWIVVSYEFLRQENANGDYPKVEMLLRALDEKKWMLVCDETAALGNWKSLQHRAIIKLRQG